MKRLIIGAAIAAIATISYIANSAGTPDRPPGVTADEWVSISASLGIVLVPGPEIIVGRVDRHGQVQMPPGGMPTLLRPPVGGYFMVKTGDDWTRLVIIEPMKGPGNAG